MRRIRLRLTKEQREQLRGLAHARGSSIHRLISEAIDDLLISEQSRSLDQAARVMAAGDRFESGRTDISERHDAHIVESIIGNDPLVG